MKALSLAIQKSSANASSLCKSKILSFRIDNNDMTKIKGFFHGKRILHNSLQYNHDSEEGSFENIVGHGENAGKPAFSHFPTVFLNLSKINLIFYLIFSFSTTDCFNVVES